MFKVEINTATGEKTEIPLTPQEVSEVAARRAAEQADQAVQCARDVLAATQQAVLEAVEFGLPVPADISAQRAAARAVLGGGHG